MLSDIKVIEFQLDNAKSYSDIFGNSTQSFEIKSHFIKLANLVRPDHVDENDKEYANVVFAKLLTLRERAKEAIRNGTYRVPISKTFNLNSSEGEYVLFETPLATGNHSKIYKGTINKTPILAKVSKFPKDNVFLEFEADILKQEIKYTPKVIDSFYLNQSVKRYRVNIMPYDKEFYSLREIKNAYTKGLDPKDSSWIFRRILGCILTADLMGVGHGAITFEHILVHPISHDPLYLGWGDTKTINKYRTEKSDVMDAALLFSSISDELPKEIKKFTQTCIADDESKRPYAYEALEEFTKIIRSLWGSEYRPLTMPTR